MSVTSLKKGGFDINTFIVAFNREQVFISQTVLNSVILSEILRLFKENIRATVL
jgi:hypothetical protein